MGEMGEEEAATTLSAREESVEVNARVIGRLIGPGPGGRSAGAHAGYDASGWPLG